MTFSERSEPRRPPPPIPLTILTGFLGAGKTTLLNRLLAAPELADTLVLINEFGEVGIDHLLVENVEGDMIVMSSGCICCSIRGDLVAALEDALRKLDNGRIRPFRRLMLETTGLADPAPILHTIMSHPYLTLRYRLDGVVTLVDAVNGAATLDAHEEAVKQAAVADRLVIAKTDLPEGSARYEELDRRLARLNPAARRLFAGEASPAALLDCGLYDASGKIPQVAEWLNDEAVAAAHESHSPRYDHDRRGPPPPRGGRSIAEGDREGVTPADSGISPHPGSLRDPTLPFEGRVSAHSDDHGHDHHHGHAHQDVNRHDAHIRAFCVASDAPLTPQAFDMFIEILRQAHGPNLLRVKGIVGLTDDRERPVAVHGVQHVFHPPHRLAAWPDADRRTRLVFIAKDLDPSFVEKLYAAVAGIPAPDTPDAAALADNPLAPKNAGLLG